MERAKGMRKKNCGRGVGGCIAVYHTEEKECVLWSDQYDWNHEEQEQIMDEKWKAVGEARFGEEEKEKEDEVSVEEEEEDEDKVEEDDVEEEEKG
jgi:hypothetical protein